MRNQAELKRIVSI